ncbi:Hypothetical predicted protein, partial [Marmota monax]
SPPRSILTPPCVHPLWSTLTFVDKAGHPETPVYAPGPNTSPEGSKCQWDAM